MVIGSPNAQIDINITDPKRATLSLDQLKNYDGMALVVKMMKKMIEGSFIMNTIALW